MIKLLRKNLSKLRYRIVNSFIHRRKKNNRFRDHLTKNNQTRWLDLGCAGTFDSNFIYADLTEPEDVPVEFRNNYFKWNATLPLDENRLQELGKFDLIRMQHVFEHFTPEQGKVVLSNCLQLLNENGYLLISVPDLRKFVRRYQNETLDYQWSFKDWAEKRIEKDAPQSFYFSIFTHSLPHQQHLWCYDAKGLKYQLRQFPEFKNIDQVKLFHRFYSIPFTHNRPMEDLCIICQKSS